MSVKISNPTNVAKAVRAEGGFVTIKPGASFDCKEAIDESYKDRLRAAGLKFSDDPAEEVIDEKPPEKSPVDASNITDAGGAPVVEEKPPAEEQATVTGAATEPVADQTPPSIPPASSALPVSNGGGPKTKGGK